MLLLCAASALDAYRPAPAPRGDWRAQPVPRNNWLYPTGSELSARALPRPLPLKQSNNVLPLVLGRKKSEGRLDASTIGAHSEELGTAAGKLTAAMFEFEHKRAASCPYSRHHSYWDDPRIHGFGNRGAWGAFHAVVAPSFTVALDVFAYGGVDVRKVAWNRIVAQRAARGAPDIAKAVDLGTGTGPTARSLARSFPGADIAAVDTSPEMLKAAADIASLEVDLDGIAFMRGNAEATGLARAERDLVAVFFLLHEAPADARARILEEAHALVAPGGTLAVCDIHPSYVPSPTMAMGEPYVAGYLANVDAECEDLAHRKDFDGHERHVVYEDRLVLWTFHRPL